MDPITIAALADAGLTILERIAPLIQSGTITPEQQAQLAARIQALHDHAAFSGPEWQVQK